MPNINTSSASDFSSVSKVIQLIFVCAVQTGPARNQSSMMFPDADLPKCKQFGYRPITLVVFSSIFRKYIKVPLQSLQYFTSFVVQCKMKLKCVPQVLFFSYDPILKPVTLHSRQAKVMSQKCIWHGQDSQ